MTIVMEHAQIFEAVSVPVERSTTAGTFELEVSIGRTPTFGFLLDPSGNATGPDHFRRGRKQLPSYFGWLRVPQEPALSLVDELLPSHPEVLPAMPFGLLVSPRWGACSRSVEVFVNTTLRLHNELLVRVPGWATTLMGHQPVEAWIELQPHLSRLGRVGLIGIESSSRGRRTLAVFLKVEDLRAEDLKRVAMLAGAPSGKLLHLWRTLSGGDGGLGPTLLSIALSGENSLDVGVTFSAQRAGTSREVQRRIEFLANVHGLQASRYVECVEELTQLTGCVPEHTMLGLSTEGSGVRISASLESVTMTTVLASQPGA